MIAQSLYQSLYRPQAFSLEKNDDIDINELSLYLDFALDKTLTARKGPTPTFSRGTSATRVNEAGLVQYAPENLFLNNGGAFRTSSLATKYSSNELDPDGGSSCLMVVETNVASQARTELPSSFADAYTRRRVFSWWVKPSPGVTLPAYLHLVYKDNARVSFSTATWSVATQTDGATGSIVESNGWYKLIAYLPGVTVSSPAHKLVFTDTDYYGGPLTAIRGLLVGSSQLSSGTFAWPHFQTLTNPYYAPRFDHDPVTLACKGLLIEESKTNSLLHSENFNNAYWLTTSGATTWQGIGSAPVITANYAASPSGLLSAYRLQLNLNGSTSISDRSGFATDILSVTSGATYTVSVYIKLLDGTTDAQLLASNIGIFTVAASATSQSIQDAGNGWKRIIRTYTSTSTSGTYRFQIVGGVGLNQVDCLIWGAQIEIGSFPTSYIPTTGTALQRSADVCSISGANFTSFYNQSEGTFFTSGVAKGALVMASSGINSDQVAIVLVPSIQRLRFDIANAGVYTAQVESGIISEGSFNKIAGSYSANDARSAFNGTLGTPDTSVTVPTNLTTLHIGKTASVSLTLNGTVARIQYFRKRLPNAKLQSLTTP